MNLKLISITIGLFMLLVRLPGVLAPQKYREFAVKFPRNIFLGRVLMGIVAAIVWWIMYHAATDEWKWAQPVVFIGVPVAYWLVYQFGTPYLAMRATAALMLLAAKQMLNATDVSEAPLRLVVVIFAYLWVITAIWLASAPHHFRDLIGWTMANDQRCRAACLAGSLVGVALIGLGLFAY